MFRDGLDALGVEPVDVHDAVLGVADQADAVALETAWQQAVTVTDPTADCDTARLYAPTDVVFRWRARPSRASGRRTTTRS